MLVRSTSFHVTLLVLVCGMILLVTLIPGQQGNGPPPACMFCGYTITADAVLNVLLFVPLGVVATLMGWRIAGVLLLGGGIAVGVEVAQYFIPGRHATFVDVSTNLMGVGIGAAIVASSEWWLRPTVARARSLSLIAILFVMSAFGLAAFLLQPTFPPATYYGQWTADFPGLVRYQGSVLSAKLGPVDLPSRMLEDSDRVRSLLVDGAPLRIWFVAGPVVRALAPILSIADHRGRRMVLVGADPDGLVVSLRRRATGWRLHEPKMRTGTAIAATPGDTIVLTVSRDSDRYYLAVGDRPLESRAMPSLSSGWTLLTAGRFAPWFEACLDTLWIAVLVLPLGFWLREIWVGLFGATAIVGFLFLVPVFEGVGSSGATEFLGVPLGFLVGMLCQVMVRRTEAT